jgi:hypothetical protein
MDTRYEQIECQCWERGEDRLDERLALCAMALAGTVYSVQQLGGGDGGDSDILGLPELSLEAPCPLGDRIASRECAGGALELDKYGRV